MVRAGHLPLRLIALRHGAHAVFSEELIAKKLLKVERVVNSGLGTIDYNLMSGGHHSGVVFRTCAMERQRVVLQIGAADALEAVQAASLFAQDVAGVDLNMGCPQHFSLSGGMGAALLKKPDLAADIVRALRTSLASSVRVSAKIRLLDDQASTIALMQQLERAGAEAITVHARRVSERPRDPARWDELRPLVECVRIPVLVNGDVWDLTDAQRVLERSGACAAMSARGALADPRLVFSGTPYSSLSDWVGDYLNVAALCDSLLGQDKWLVSQIIRYRSKNEPSNAERNNRVAQSKSKEDLRQAFNLPALPATHSPWTTTEPTAEAWNLAVQRAMQGSKVDIQGAAHVDDDEAEPAKRMKEMELL